eukprot:TRINITY_DN40406_c0_g1_i1.p1 TRINITY_DN40406_c0_g1~~TRINITY_DN40406_c0_g1_i1.p1  ORF type:complete len:321 (+),score=55.07 TRINITY_DN40406_c0_g1_i1:115-963(+)
MRELQHPEFAPFVGPSVLLATTVAYVGTAFGLRRYMVGRPAYSLAGVKQLYNACQVGLSLLTACMLARHWSIWNPFMLNEPFSADLEYWLFVNYVGKYFDLLETVIIVLRKREDQLTPMHLYHHASMLCVLGWLLHVGYANGTAAFGAFANSVVHALMFGHLYSEGGSRCMVHVLNRYTVTFLQLLQFLAVVVHATLAVAFETIIPPKYCAVQLVYGVSLIVFFLSVARNGRRARIGRDQMVATAQRTLRKSPQHLPSLPPPMPSPTSCPTAGVQRPFKLEE